MLIWGVFYITKDGAPLSKLVSNLHLPTTQVGSFWVIQNVTGTMEPMSMCSWLNHFCFKIVSLALFVVLRNSMLVDQNSIIG